MAGLTGSTIASSYEQLLIVADGGLTTSLQAIQDGIGGVTSCLKIAKDKLEIIPNAANNANLFEVSQYGGASIFNINSTTPGATLIGTLTIGASTDGYDVKLFGNTSGHYLLWDESADDLIVVGGMYATGTNAGTSNTVYGKTAGAALASGGNYNALLGEEAGNDLTTGVNNVAIGYQALDKGTTESDDNVAIGYQAMHGNFTTNAVNDCVAVGSLALDGVLTSAASGAVAIGLSALGALTSGARNTAIGYNAGVLLQTGDLNTALGFQALATNVYGDNNTAIGERALTTYASADGTGKNTAVGALAGQDLEAGVFNTFIGSSSGANCTAAVNCTAVGQQSMHGITTAVVTGCVAIGKNAFLGSSSTTDGTNGTVAIGMDALQALTTGAANVAIGYQAGLAVTSGGQNTVLGYQAFYASSANGDSNTAIGYAALQDMQADTDGHGDNTAVGAYTCWNLTTGTHNVAVGSRAMGFGNTTGDGNICIGYEAGEDLTSGSSNIAIGYNALLDHTTGGRNIAIGHNVMDGTGGATVLGSMDNIFIGYDAGGGTWTTAVSNQNIGIGNGTMDAAMNGALLNTALGYNCASNITTGDANICIGAHAGNNDINLITGSNNTLIGTYADVSATDSTNQTVIGYDAIGQADYSVTLGSAAVTAVYMGSDSGAAVHCGTVISTPDAITATNSGVAASVGTLSTEVTTNGDGDLDNVTLANGTSGQVKNIYCVVEGAGGDTWKITPATMCGGTQITFAGVGLGCTMVYADNEGWVVTGNNGGTIS